MTIGELISAAVVDERVWDAYQETAPDGIYLVGQPGPALPFVIFRAWKVPTGFVSDEIRLAAVRAHVVGDVARRGTHEVRWIHRRARRIEMRCWKRPVLRGLFHTRGGDPGETSPVYVQAARRSSEGDREGLRKFDVIWVGTRVNGDSGGPVWFAVRTEVFCCPDTIPRRMNKRARPGRQELVVVPAQARDTPSPRSTRRSGFSKERRGGRSQDAVDRARRSVAAESLSRWAASATREPRRTWLRR